MITKYFFDHPKSIVRAIDEMELHLLLRVSYLLSKWMLLVIAKFWPFISLLAHSGLTGYFPHSCSVAPELKRTTKEYTA